MLSILAFLGRCPRLGCNRAVGSQKKFFVFLRLTIFNHPRNKAPKARPQPSLGRCPRFLIRLSCDPIAAAHRLQAVAGIASLATTTQAEKLSEILLLSKAVPANSARDALHISIAATQGVKFLLTWNFKHINNAETRAPIARVVAENGWNCPVLCSPEELGGIDYAK